VTTLASAKGPHGITRPLRVLEPLIKDDLRRGNEAGLEYYRAAGDKLREARTQVATHRWGAWLSQKFELSRMTAWRYMRLSELYEEGTVSHEDTSYRELTEPGHTAKQRARTQKTRPYRKAISDVDVDDIARHRDTREEEVRLHRELALQLIDIGFKALATRLHPDRGGSRIGMQRLNTVRRHLTDFAKSRRFD
jgi:Protein of unknown function (DUF3102)